MKILAISAFALASMSSAALAAPKPMTNAQMDKVTAGALLEVNVRNNDIDILNNNRVAVQAAVNAAVGVLSTNTTAAQRAAGRITQ